MQLFLIFFAPGMLVCWLYVRNRNSWGHTVIGIILGSATAYGALYVMGNFVQGEQFNQMRRDLGNALAVQMINNLYGNALKYAVGAIIGTAIALKLRSGRSPAN